MAYGVDEFGELRAVADTGTLLAAAPASYVLPILCTQAGSDMEDLTVYLDRMSAHAELVIVDGSAGETFERNHELWGHLGVHIRPDPAHRCLNGKAWGVMTGVWAASHELVIIADDDVRYDERAFNEVLRSLTGADLVRPQNYFDPLPWHAAWDTARSLLNRSTGSDHPGTLGVRRSTLVGGGGYDGDVLFENLELVRTIESMGGSVVDRPDIYVRRIPPTVQRFWSQRVRQAYDDLSQPLRLALFLTVLPAIAIAIGLRRSRSVLLGGAVIVAIAERGRRRHGGRRVFRARCLALAPGWVLERAVCVWLALWLRLFRGGVPYAGHTIIVAANPRRGLRDRTRAGRLLR
jgi:glycosyl transferase family 21